MQLQVLAAIAVGCQAFKGPLNLVFATSCMAQCKSRHTCAWRFGLAQRATYADRLAFARADAKAIGQVLIIETQGMNAEAWESCKKRAFQKAAQLWAYNRQRAPWGCLWFKK